VYIYRVSLETINGVSSTKGISIAALSLERGEIRQIQFVDEENTVMVLFSDAGTFVTVVLLVFIRPLENNQR
jgi:anaphase-promoting complex subunit 4